MVAIVCVQELSRRHSSSVTLLPWPLCPHCSVLAVVVRRLQKTWQTSSTDWACLFLPRSPSLIVFLLTLPNVEGTTRVTVCYPLACGERGRNWHLPRLFVTRVLPNSSLDSARVSLPEQAFVQPLCSSNRALVVRVPSLLYVTASIARAPASFGRSAETSAGLLLKLCRLPG